MGKEILDMNIADKVSCLCNDLLLLPEKERIEVINNIKIDLHNISPLKNEPVDCIIWVNASRVEANDYNPNTVAPPEMKLLEHSIREDGYTQPIVVYKDVSIDNYIVVDGFHRNKVGVECHDIGQRIYNLLPVSIINNNRNGRSDRIAATIRHNRARGKHQIQSMSEIVLELSRRNWSDKKIGKELGMEEDEILRLKQISGLADAFSDKLFSEAWESEIENN